MEAAAMEAAMVEAAKAADGFLHVAPRHLMQRTQTICFLNQPHADKSARACEPQTVRIARVDVRVAEAAAPVW